MSIIHSEIDALSVLMLICDIMDSRDGYPEKPGQTEADWLKAEYSIDARIEELHAKLVGVIRRDRQLNIKNNDLATRLQEIADKLRRTTKPDSWLESPYSSLIVANLEEAASLLKLESYV